MKYFDWDEDKNQKLKEEREISFQEVVDAINDNNLLANIKHPNQKKYPGQEMMIVKINNYAYVAPYVQTEEKVFFKTIYPSRAATRKYLIKKEVRKDEIL